MKLLISSALTAIMTLTAALPAFAQQQTARQGEIEANRVALIQSKNDLVSLNLKLEKAKALRTTALWVGIPVAVGTAGYGLFSGFVTTIAKTWGVGSYATAGKYLAVSLVATSATTAIAVIKTSEIKEWQKEIAQAESENETALNALVALEGK